MEITWQQALLKTWKDITIFLSKYRKRISCLVISLAVFFAAPYICIAVFLVLVIAGGEPSSPKIPDTKENIKGFEKHFRFPPSSDVTEIYYFADTIGIDYKFQLGFKADRSTVEKIATRIKLQPTEKCHPSIAQDFFWWKNEELENIELCWKREINTLYQYLWYDEKTRRAWFLDFDT